MGYNVGSTLDWVVGRPLFGRAGIKLDRRQPTVQDRIYNQTTNVSGDRNNISTQNLFFNAGFRFTPAWSVIGGVDYVRSRNSLEVYKDTDYDLKSGEGGVRYAPGTASRSTWSTVPPAASTSRPSAMVTTAPPCCAQQTAARTTTTRTRCRPASSIVPARTAAWAASSATPVVTTIRATATSAA